MFAFIIYPNQYYIQNILPQKNELRRGKNRKKNEKEQNWCLIYWNVLLIGLNSYFNKYLCSNEGMKLLVLQKLHGSELR